MVFVNDPITVVVAPPIVPFRASRVFTVRARVPPSVPPRSTTVGRVVAGDAPLSVTLPPASVNFPGVKTEPACVVIEPPEAVSAPAPSSTPLSMSGMPPPSRHTVAAAPIAMCPPSLPAGAGPLIVRVPPARLRSPSTSKIVFTSRLPPATTSEPAGEIRNRGEPPAQSRRLSAPAPTLSVAVSWTRPPDMQSVPSDQVPFAVMLTVTLLRIVMFVVCCVQPPFALSVPGPSNCPPFIVVAPLTVSARLFMNCTWEDVSVRDWTVTSATLMTTLLFVGTETASFESGIPSASAVGTTSHVQTLGVFQSPPLNDAV